MIVEKTDMSVGVREELVMCVDDHQGKFVGLQRSLEIGFCVEGSGSVTSRKSDKCEDVFVCSDYCYSRHVYEETCLPYRIESSPVLFYTSKNHWWIFYKDLIWGFTGFSIGETRRICWGWEEVYHARHVCGEFVKPQQMSRLIWMNQPHSLQKLSMTKSDEI